MNYFHKSFILDVSRDSEYASDNFYWICDLKNS